MSDALTAITPADARRVAAEVRALISGRHPDADKARAVLAQFQASLWVDFAKHGDARIRAIAAIVDALRAELEGR